MKTINQLAKYYKQCLYEEAKVSAFSNLNKEDNTMVQLVNGVTVLHEYPKLVSVVKESQALTNLSVKARMDKSKQLIYGYMFIHGKLLDGTEIYTPLFYANCSLERVNGDMTVGIDTDTMSINLPALIQLVPNNEDKDMLVEQLIDQKVTLPVSDNVVSGIINTLKDTINILGTLVLIEDKEAVILTTINKGLAGVINELNEIANGSPVDMCNTALNVYSTNELDTLNEIYSAVRLDESQEHVLNTASHDLITAVTGGPGTGKSTTIAGIASNYIMNGKSVLICSKQNSAVDVLYNKMAKLTPNITSVIRTGGKEYRKELADIIDKVLNNQFNDTVIGCAKNSREVLENLVKTYKDYKSAEYRAELHRNIYHELFAKAQNEKNILSKFLTNISVKNAEKEWTKNADLCAEIHDTKIKNEHNYKNDIITMTQDTMYQEAKLRLYNVKNNVPLRRLLMVLARALKKGNIESLETSYDSIFKMIVEQVFQCWCTTTVDVSTSIPFIPGLFDVVIIDEASQCDIATCLPLLYRAKRAVIVGDDKQLKYISFIPTAVNNANMKSAGVNPEDMYICNYRENSMFDFASYYSNGNVMLQQQYRGCPDIMDFSNHKFYNDNIRNVCVNRPLPIINHIIADGSVANGKTVNKVEVEAVIEHIKDILNTADSELTIGVLSPFRDQVKAIEKAIYETFTTEEIEKHQIHVGTAHSFQGEERDIMILSWTVADNSLVQQFSFINNPNLFNVAITRASEQVINLISASNLPKGLLKEYIEYCFNVEGSEARKERVMVGV